MPIIFKYKTPIGLSYAPGTVINGDDGEEGNQGKYGNSIYFSDFDFDNSYNIELALQKIENNYILSSDNFVKIPDERKYKENDLILSSSGKCYRITKQTGETFSNYTYNIEYIGPVVNKAAPKISYVSFTDITDTDNNHKGEVRGVGKGMVSGKDGVLRGKWFRIKLVGTDDSVDHFLTKAISDPNNPATQEERLISELYKSLFYNNDNEPHYRYSLEIRLKNRKLYRRGEFPNTNSHRLDFFKTIRISNLDLHKEIPNSSGDNKSSEESRFLASKEIFISNEMLDRMHPAGNNWGWNVDNSKSIWRRTGIKGDNDTYTTNALKINDEFEFESDSTIDMLISSNAFRYKYSGTRYDNDGNTVLDLKNDSHNRHRDLENLMNLPKYSTGKRKGVDSSADIYLDKTLEENVKALDQICELNKSTNPSAGNSTYFSSIPDVDNLSQKIDDFLFHKDNEFVITIKNLRTNEVSFVEVPFIEERVNVNR